MSCDTNFTCDSCLWDAIKTGMWVSFIFKYPLSYSVHLVTFGLKHLNAFQRSRHLTNIRFMNSFIITSCKGNRSQSFQYYRIRKKRDLVGTSTPSFPLRAFSFLSSLAPQDGKGNISWSKKQIQLVVTASLGWANKKVVKKFCYNLFSIVSCYSL